MFENFVHKCRKYLAFDTHELNVLLVTVLLLAFIVGFDDGTESFDAARWGFNYLMILLLITMSVIAHVMTQRIFALRNGYKPILRLNWYMLITGLVLAFISMGQFWFFLVPGIFVMEMLEAHRIGSFRYGFSMKQFGWIASTGCLANIFLAVFFKILLLAQPQSAFLKLGMYINIAMAISNLLPIPPLNGSKLFFGNRVFYTFIGGLIVGLSLFLVALDSIFLSILFALVIAIIAYYFGSEHLE